MRAVRRICTEATMHDDDHGPQLQGDLRTFMKRGLSTSANRRQVLKGLFGFSVLTVVACGTDSDPGSTLENDDGTCNIIPEETAGPYPGDGSNGVNALTLSGIVRSDLRTSIGDLSGTAAGVPMTITLTLLDQDCAPLVGKAIYLWHCDRDGAYSMYDVEEQNYLRGVQETDADGKVTFTSIFPACYAGRWPHMHFEVYESLATATSSSNVLATSQLAIPEAACADVYGTADGYDRSVDNLAGVSLESDNVFSDGTTRQLATVTGSVDDGYAATLSFAIAV